MCFCHKILLLTIALLLGGCYSSKLSERMDSSKQRTSVAMASMASTTAINTIETADSIVIKEFIHDTISKIKTIYRPGRTIEHRDTVSVVQKEVVHLKDTVYFTKKEETKGGLVDRSFYFLLIGFCVFAAVLFIVKK